MKFLPIFDLRVRHAFYSELRSPDFLIEPTDETTRLLSSHRAMAKSLPDGIRIVTAVAESGEAFIPFSSGAIFRFHMSLQNAEFALITDSRDIAMTASPLYTNAPLSGADDVELAFTSNEAWSLDTLKVIEPSSNERFVLSGKPIEGASAANFLIESAGPIQGVVEYDAQAKVIIIDSRSASRGQIFNVKYPVIAHLPSGVFASIEIHANDSLPNLVTPTAISREFRISFRAKQAKWAYYCLTDLANPETAYRIVDTPPTDGEVPLVFSESNRINLVANPDSSDNVAGELAERYPTLKRYRFLSDTPVACRQAARKHLVLFVNDNKLSDPLANPSVRNFSTVRVKVGDTMQNQDWLFEIVKVITHNGA